MCRAIRIKAHSVYTVFSGQIDLVGRFTYSSICTLNRDRRKYFKIEILRSALNRLVPS